MTSAAPPTFTYCPDPVFVIGSPRSGTTALAAALGHHPSFFVGDETFFLWELFSQGRLERTHRQWAARPSSSWLRREGVGEAEFLAAAGLGFNVLLTRSAGSRRWVDHTPHHCHMADTLAAMFPGARFLHVLRDGRDVVNSMLHIAATLPVEELDRMRRAGFLPPWADDFRAACTTWREAVRAGIGFCAREPARALTVLQRDLEREPAATLSRVFAFLGAGDHPAPATFLRERRVNSSFAPPGGMAAADYRRPNPLTEWPQERLAIFAEITGDLAEVGRIDGAGTTTA